MKYFISLLIFTILISSSYQRKKCFAVITPEIISELRQIILKAGLQESQLDKFVEVVRISVEVAPDIEISKYVQITEAAPDYILAVLQKVRAAGLNQFTPEIRASIENDVKAFAPKLSSTQIQDTIRAYEIDVFESIPLGDDARIKEFLTNLVFFIYDVITNAMSLPANSPYAATITPQVKSNIRNAVLKAGLDESKVISFLEATRVIVKIGMKIDTTNIDKVAETLPDFVVPLVRNVTTTGLDHFTQDFKNIIETKTLEYAANLSKSDIQTLIRQYEILTFEAASIKDDDRLGQLVIDIMNIVNNIIRCRKN